MSRRRCFTRWRSKPAGDITPCRAHCPSGLSLVSWEILLKLSVRLLADLQDRLFHCLLMFGHLTSEIGLSPDPARLGREIPSELCIVGFVATSRTLFIPTLSYHQIISWPPSKGPSEFCILLNACLATERLSAVVRLGPGWAGKGWPNSAGLIRSVGEAPSSHLLCSILVPGTQLPLLGDVSSLVPRPPTAQPSEPPPLKTSNLRLPGDST